MRSNNLVWLKADVHKLIHCKLPETINKYVNKLKLDQKALKRVNSLRLLTENKKIEISNIV